MRLSVVGSHSPGSRAQIIEWPCHSAPFLLASAYFHLIQRNPLSHSTLSRLSFAAGAEPTFPSKSTRMCLARERQGRARLHGFWHRDVSHSDPSRFLFSHPNPACAVQGFGGMSPPRGFAGTGASRHICHSGVSWAGFRMDAQTLSSTDWT